MSESKKEDGMEFVSIPLSQQDAEEVERISTEKGMSVQTFLRRTVRKRIEEERKKELDTE